MPQPKCAAASAVFLVVCLLLIPALSVGKSPRLIEVVADKDNRFKVPGQKKPIITAKAGEVVRLRITSHKGTEWHKDGWVHSFTITALKDQGWDLLLKEGTQEFTLVVPQEPGEYEIVCTINCGRGHEEMRMKLVVTP